MDKYFTERANYFMYTDIQSDNIKLEAEEGKTITINFKKSDVNVDTLDEIDAKLVRAGLVGTPDFTDMTYTIKAEHLDRFIDIMKNSTYDYTYENEIKEDETELFSLAEDLVSGLTYEQLINTVEANEQVRDEDAVEKVFVEELSRIIEEARENFELNKDKIMAGLGGEEETNEGMFSKGKSKEELIAKSMVRLIKDKGVDVKTVITLMMDKYR